MRQHTVDEIRPFSLLQLIFALLVAIAVLALGVNAFAATLTWKDNASNEAGYAVERAPVPCAPVPTNFTEIARTGKDVAGYVDAGAQPNTGTRWCYRVRAFNYRFAGDLESAQYSGFSNLAGIEYPLPLPDAVPDQLSVTP